MAHLIKPNNVKIIAKDGEIQVSLSIDLNINLNSDVINVQTQSIPIENHKKNEKNLEIDETDILIPDIFNSPIIEFGKQE